MVYVYGQFLVYSEIHVQNELWFFIYVCMYIIIKCIIYTGLFCSPILLILFYIFVLKVRGFSSMGQLQPRFTWFRQCVTMVKRPMSGTVRSYIYTQRGQACITIQNMMVGATAISLYKVECEKRECERFFFCFFIQ